MRINAKHTIFILFYSILLTFSTKEGETIQNALNG